ncbi:hypothetical protein BT96DRAFT_1001469 [Gymnopus androsaceus JB14]|uniref:Uncharacterized protein n=1 Tax=Gymnopus androsaceus JB14 TaxID=1447944 RepID=A0A6A4H0K1_9AGAR|nr:hypothetical protein BT96DRAFT_1001469 [Gymnopus androsaceus JB14]
MDTGAFINVTATNNCKVCGDSNLYLLTSAWNGSTYSVFVSSSSVDSSSPTSVSVAKAITTSSVSSSIAVTSTLTSVACSTLNTTFAVATGSSFNGWTLSQSLTGQNLINYFATLSSNDSGVVNYINNLICTDSDGNVIM